MALPAIACTVDWPGTANFLKDIAISCAAIFTAWVAHKGISKWRGEESGKADFELARRVGKTVFRLRDVLSEARRGFTLNYEFPEGYDSTDLSQQADAWAHVFDSRIQPVKSAALELLSLSNEAEALWGEDVVVKVNGLIKQVNSLQIAMGAYLRNKQAFGAHFANNQAFADQIEAKIFDTEILLREDGFQPAPNPYTAEIQASVEELATYLRTKLPQMP